MSLIFQHKHFVTQTIKLFSHFWLRRYGMVYMYMANTVNEAFKIFYSTITFYFELSLPVKHIEKEQ